MPILWDIMLCVVAGFYFSSLGRIIENLTVFKIKEKYFYFLGFVFTIFVDMLISIWCWEKVDQNWLLLYAIDSKSVDGMVYLIYASFPIIYTMSFDLNIRLGKTRFARIGPFVVTTFWIIFTLVVIDPFVTIFKGDDRNLLGFDYPAQPLWDINIYPPENALWIFPMNYRSFFINFFLIVILLMVVFELTAILILLKNFLEPKTGHTPKALVKVTSFILDYSNKLLIKKATKDLRFRRFVANFKATIQISTRDDFIHRFIIFDGKGGIRYCRGISDNPDATIIYRSVRDLLIFLKNYGDIYEGMLENRFELRGNLTALY
ncbi:MAG: hypothetical protein ACTSRA_13780, partial [Promethearchaeota archaeon]